jgi:hypothetical protein
MSSEGVEEKLLVRYLLGELSEDEQVQVEDRAFADPRYLDALESAEADLIDAWVRGDLSDADRRAFEGRFLVSPERRRKVQLAKDLAKIGDEIRTAERAAVGRVSFWRSLAMLARGWRPAFAFAGALAAVVCLGGVLWQMSQNGAMRSRVAELEAGRRKALDELAAERSRAESLSAQLVQRPGAARPVPTSLVLIPGVSRGEASSQTLTLGPSTQVARITIQLERRDDFPRFRVELRTRAGEEVLTAGNLARGRDSVSFEAPAGLLAAGEYELALKGVHADQTLSDIGYFYFAVRKR